MFKLPRYDTQSTRTRLSHDFRRIENKIKTIKELQNGY